MKQLTANSSEISQQQINKRREQRPLADRGQSESDQFWSIQSLTREAIWIKRRNEWDLKLTNSKGDEQQELDQFNCYMITKLIMEFSTNKYWYRCMGFSTTEVNAGGQKFRVQMRKGGVAGPWVSSLPGTDFPRNVTQNTNSQPGSKTQYNVLFIHRLN